MLHDAVVEGSSLLLSRIACREQQVNSRVCVQMSLADLTRVHSLTAPTNGATGAIGAERRVAYAEETQEGLNILTAWAASNLSRQDDTDFQVMVRMLCFLAARS
jgi:hypothetical protein